MSDHALFSPSSASRWMRCAGSVKLHKSTSSVYADEGTAAHELGAWCLNHPDSMADDRVGETIAVGGRDFTVDQDFADAVQIYVNDARARGKDCYQLVEVRVDLSKSLGVPDQFGTSDFIAISRDFKHVTVEDLKFGRGVKVYAEKNEQGMEYALGALEALEFAGFDVALIEHVTIVICQPRIDHIDEWTISLADLRAFEAETRKAVERCQTALMLDVGTPAFETTLTPGEKQCQWCSAKATCPALAKFVSAQVFGEFDAIDDPTTIAMKPPKPPIDAATLGQRMGIIDMIQDWCKAVRAEGERRVLSGDTIPGTDGLPYKIVEGKRGNRAWSDEAKAEEALVAALADAAYKPKEIITASAAAKILDKPKTREHWAAAFVPLITQPNGALSVVAGSDPRPAVSKAAVADDFSDV
jgi:hypothetical protein